MTYFYLQNRKFILLFAILLFAGCANFNRVTREVRTKDSFQSLTPVQILNLKEDSPFLKIHMKNGSVYVLHDWTSQPASSLIIGKGTLLDENRDTLSSGEFNVGMDSVSLLETNVIKPSGSQIALTIFTGITAAVTIACLTNPKACFGSCPTFYVEDKDSFHLRAEGFSSSITPSLEATDIDDLYRQANGGDDFNLVMKNEALETHIVRSVNLIAVPKEKDSRVFADNNDSFWESKIQISPASARSVQGDAAKLLESFDGNEWFSKADSNYLGAKEIIELEFDNVPQTQLGLVIGCRQTLLSTYLLYQAFAYMGNNVGYWLTQIQQQKLKLSQNPITKIMGGIEILTQDSSSEWKVNGIVDEEGPLADDVHLIPLTTTANKNLIVRLRMTKGNWRIDYAALALDLKQAAPTTINPTLVLKEGIVDEDARIKLCDSTKVLTTMPGDIYSLKYKIPITAPCYELFLESRGYYLEWIRKEWLKEENQAYLMQMFLEPQRTLKRLAPEFKSVEAKMEESFWRSRYAKP